LCGNEQKRLNGATHGPLSRSDPKMFASLHRDFKMMFGAQIAVTAGAGPMRLSGVCSGRTRGLRVLTTKSARQKIHGSGGYGLSRR
jgi:hypothetical protein